MDPVRNPYAPGAGQRPPELAGRDRELGRFDVVLERVARGRPERSLVLTGLRGVGKTVLLNQLRSQAIGRLWGTGKIEARPDQSIRRPVAAALHNEGLDNVWRHVRRHRDWLVDRGDLDAKRRRQLVDWTRALVRDRLLSRLDTVKAVVAATEAAVQAGDLTPDQAATRILAALD